MIDAIEGPQILSYLAGMDVKMPPDVNIFLATIKNAASVEPSYLFRSEDDPSIAEMVFGELPESEPLNDRLERMGYLSLIPIDEVESVSVEMMVAVSALIFMILLFYCKSFRRSYLAGIWQEKIGEFVLWGTFIDIITINYLPVITATFISVIGLQWNDLNSNMLYTNLWTIFMLSCWVSFPIIMLFAIMRER